MITALNQLVEAVERVTAEEYVRRRRMTQSAADVAESSDDLLTIAVRHGYGSTEAFGRAFRAVHGIGPSDARRDGGPFRSQQQLRFRLTVEGITPMHVRITDRPAFRLVGHATRVPLVHEGVNPHIQAHVAAIPIQEHLRLTYMHGVAVTDDTPPPGDLEIIGVAAGSWAVFTTEGPHPQALQETWAATAAEWFPSNPWRLRPGPSIVAVLEHDEDFTVATCEHWLPVERA